MKTAAAEEIVILRGWKDTAELIALWPAVPASLDGHLCQSYMHIGQHSAADYQHVIRQTDAVPEVGLPELEFLKELESIGYDPHLRSYCSPIWHQIRRQQAKLNLEQRTAVVD